MLHELMPPRVIPEYGIKGIPLTSRSSRLVTRMIYCGAQVGRQEMRRTLGTRADPEILLHPHTAGRAATGDSMDGCARGPRAASWRSVASWRLRSGGAGRSALGFLLLQCNQIG